MEEQCRLLLPLCPVLTFASSILFRPSHSLSLSLFLFSDAGEVSVAVGGGEQEGEPVAEGAQPRAREGGRGAQEDHHAAGRAVQPEAGPASRCAFSDPDELG